MSESGDYDPGYWRGHDFADARASYGNYATTSLKSAVDSGVTTKDLVPESISTQSENPLVIVTDQTSSMAEWPTVIFSKLPYLEHEAKTEYMGENVEISWGAIGDAHNNEKYPLQVRPFSKGKDLVVRMKELIHEKKGGGTHQETYELAALYYARNVLMPNAIRPLLIFIGDESPYERVSEEMADRIAHVKLKSSIGTEVVFRELANKYSVYLIQKPYNKSDLKDNGLEGISAKVHANWLNLLGSEERIAILDDPNRVVDVIFGIMAREARKISYFKEELEGRQTPGQVRTVLRALKTIHAIQESSKPMRLLGGGHSITRRKS